jgi:hypothetical protein
MHPNTKGDSTHASLQESLSGGKMKDQVFSSWSLKTASYVGLEGNMEKIPTHKNSIFVIAEKCLWP